MKLIALSMLAVTLAFSPAAAQVSGAPQPGTADYDRWVGQQLNRLQQAADRDAVRQLMFHYGRGNDEIARNYADRETGSRRGTAEFEQAFASDVQITVIPLRAPTPLAQVKGIGDWVKFVSGYFDQQKYSNTLHLMSNFSVTFTNAATAEATAFANVPHYILSAAKTASDANVTVENMLCRYVYTARRQQDGSWRIATMTIYLDEIQRQSGFYPNGQQPGR
jgi:SnoaL-like domain